MGKHRVKCLACKAQKEFFPDRRFYRVPGDSMRRAEWLNGIKKGDLINVKISNDLRVCELHFDKEHVPKFTNRIRKNGVPFLVEEEIKDTETDKKILQSVPIKLEVNGEIEIDPEIKQEIIDITTESEQVVETKTTEPCPEECAIAYYNPYKSTVIDIEELRKLREECINLRKQIEHCNKNEFFIEKGKSILPPQLAQMVENHLTYPGSVMPVYMSPAKVTVLCGGFSKKV